LCYGIHNLFNVVTNGADTADAVLIRALQPTTGETFMMERRGKIQHNLHLTSGPGKLTKALGIDRKWNGKFLLDNDIWIEDLGEKVSGKTIDASPRIGIDYAGEDAKLPWRFTIRDNPWISR
jgi:DNA-3-methyladenine glycosylase